MHWNGEGTVTLLTGGLCRSVTSRQISFYLVSSPCPQIFCAISLICPHLFKDRKQIHCGECILVRINIIVSLSSPVFPAPSPSLPTLPVEVAPLGGNMVMVAGISICLAVILATVVVTVWRKLCKTPQCSSVRRGSIHSPGGRKLSDEASICGHSLQRPSLSDGHGPPGSVAVGMAQEDRPSPCSQPLSQTLMMPLSHNPERLSPTGQKMLPPIFGYV